MARAMARCVFPVPGVPKKQTFTVAVPTQLDALMNQALRGAVIATAVPEIAV